MSELEIHDSAPTFFSEINQQYFPDTIVQCEVLSHEVKKISTVRYDAWLEDRRFESHGTV